MATSRRMTIPHARGPISAGLFRLLAGGPGDDPAALGALHDLAEAQLPLTDDIIDDGDVQLSLFCLYELHYGGLDGVDRPLGMEPRADRAPAADRGAFRACAALGGAPVRRRRPACIRRGPGQRRGGGHPVRDRRPGGRTEHVPPRRQEGDPGAAPRIPDPQIDLSAQGSRPAHLGDPAAARPGQGRAGGDPGRRVRRRPPGPHAQHPLRPDHARAGAGRPLRRLRGRRPAHLPRLGQRDVPLRAEPHGSAGPSPGTWRSTR